MRYCKDCKNPLASRSLKVQRCPDCYHLIPYTKERKNKISLSNTLNYKKEKVSYRGVHSRIYKLLGSPMVCKHCNQIKKNNREIHWANISDNYLTDKNDWIRLCAKCHKYFDKTKKLYVKQGNNNRNLEKHYR